MFFNSLWIWELVNILYIFVFVLFLNVDYINIMYILEM